MAGCSLKETFLRTGLSLASKAASSKGWLYTADSCMGSMTMGVVYEGLVLGGGETMGGETIATSDPLGPVSAEIAKGLGADRAISGSGICQQTSVPASFSAIEFIIPSG